MHSAIKYLRVNGSNAISHGVRLCMLCGERERERESSKQYLRRRLSTTPMCKMLPLPEESYLSEKLFAESKVNDFDAV